jgi:iron-sulfur cluster assembly protein
MILLTDSAIEHLRLLLAERAAEPGIGLRLTVERGGCAGLQYTMRVDQSGEGDQVFERGGVAVIVDPGSFSYLDGSEIDYVDELNDSGFKVRNPKAARSCGCGTSFEPQEAAVP